MPSQSGYAFQNDLAAVQAEVAGLSAGTFPPGVILAYGGAAAPAGWLLCDGSAVSRVTFAALFAILGTAYGAGDGSTTFLLPDLRGRAPLGLKSTDADFDALGKAPGAKEVAAVGTNSAPTFAGAALATHAHGAGTLVPSAHAGAAVADHPSHTHAYTEVPNHVHGVSTILRTATTGGGTTQVTNAQDTSSTPDTTRKTDNPDGGVASGTTQGPSATLSHQVTQPSAHTMSGTSEAVSAGTPAGTVTAPTFTGSPTSVVQPSLVVNFIVKT